MSKGPFIDDPREVMRQQIALAVASPLEDVRAIHIRAAEHQASIARESALPFTETIREGGIDKARK